MNAFVRQLAALSVLWSLCELLMPEGRQQKMVRMTVSVLVMASLIAAISGLLSTQTETGLPAAAQAVEAAGAESYARTALRAAANQAEAFCVRLAARAGYDARAAVYLTGDGAVDHIDLILDGRDAPLISVEEVASAIAGQLSISRELVRVAGSGADGP